MDNFFGILGLVAAGILLAIVILKIGFAVRPHPRLPDLADEKPAVEQLDLPAELPEAVQLFYRAVYANGHIPAPRAVVAYGTGRFRVRRLPLFGYLWAPLTWQIHLIPGESFIWKIRLVWFNFPVAQGGDGYINQHGLFKMGTQVLDGENMDYSELVMLGMYSLIFAPGALLDLPYAAWQPVDEHSARLVWPLGGRSLEYNVTFNPENHLIARVETQRPGNRTGSLFPYVFSLSDKALFNEEINLPDQLGTAWETDTYATYVLDGIQYNGPVEEVMADGIK